MEASPSLHAVSFFSSVHRGLLFWRWSSWLRANTLFTNYKQHLAACSRSCIVSSRCWCPMWDQHREFFGKNLENLNVASSNTNASSFTTSATANVIQSTDTEVSSSNSNSGAEVQKNGANITGQLEKLIALDSAWCQDVVVIPGKGTQRPLESNIAKVVKLVLIALVTSCTSERSCWRILIWMSPQMNSSRPQPKGETLSCWKIKI